ncbi:glycoside hydrolase family 3 N-terminal domain-containing protein [Herbidospora yilanensis]|uniref:glycoside hydrolase family 3 N-terminal domain-containing protein n=1 Tax=Herbidospora yilanensis TaxID=354426 RepID=UPI00078506F9|nr:glycoside hydrolase family 3 N-terminal domain-containing protein [Herbidospora yilanensis]
MRLERMAMSVLQPGFDGTAPPDWLRRALGDGLGGVVLFARNLSDQVRTADLVADIRAESPDVVVAVDEEGGSVTRLEARTGSSWPGNRALGVADDVHVTELVARRIGRLLGTTGISLDYAPVADVNANPDNPVIGVRSFGADPGLVARHTAAWVGGLQGSGVAACAKHFPGHGDTIADSHVELPTVHASPETLAERDLRPFRAAIDAGVRAIMVGHLLVPALDAVPATLSHAVMTGLLRDTLGFRGLAVTDAIEMRAVAAHWPPEEIAVRALSVGADAVCAGISSSDGSSVYALRDAIVAAVRQGRLPEERLAEASQRVRDLVGWHAGQAAARAAAAAEPDDDLGLTAALAALHVVGEPHLDRAPLVVEVTARPHQAADSGTPPGVARALAELLPGTQAVSVTVGDPLPDLGSDRPLVVVVQDAARHGWIREVLGRALEARPDAIVVETGLPGPPAGAGYVATHGNSRASARAAARRLAHRPPTPEKESPP